MKNRALKARNLGKGSLDPSSSTTNIKKLINPAMGGAIGVRNFGGKLGGQHQPVKAFAQGHGHKLLLEENQDYTSDGYDDNMSDGGIIRIGGAGSEYSRDQSFLSIRQYESSDGDSQLYR